MCVCACIHISERHTGMCVCMCVFTFQSVTQVCVCMRVCVRVRNCEGVNGIACFLIRTALAPTGCLTPSSTLLGNSLSCRLNNPFTSLAPQKGASSVSKKASSHHSILVSLIDFSHNYVMQ